MDTEQKLDILAEDSQYDLACSCGSSDEKNGHRRRSGDGSRWLYPVPLTRGGSGLMFKTLLSNTCSSDCRYCPLRHDGSSPHRCSITPDEAARKFMDINSRRWLLGAFFTSGIVGSADNTMRLLTDTAAILRNRYRYRGYIHLKIIPGASDEAVRYALSLASAVSLNIETPGRSHFAKLSSYKDYDRDIIAPLKLISAETAKGMPRSRVKCTTQFIVGASDEKDSEIIRYMGRIYDGLNFERVYFSAYQPGLGDPRIPGEKDFNLEPSGRLTREHRLYQADFLIRKYGFGAEEIPCGRDGGLDLVRDPKEMWALNHPEFYPVRVNRASKEELLRIPGVGPVAAARIIAARRAGRIRSFAEAGMKGALAGKALAYSDLS